MQTTAVKQRPILMSTPMVQSTLENRKTKTRRVVKTDLSMFLEGDIIENNKQWGWCIKRPFVTKTGAIIYEIQKIFECPYGRVGDVLWVRETFVRGCIDDGEGNVSEPRIWYRADGDCPDEWHNEKKGEPGNIPWKHSIFMPYAACRLFLRITDIRVESLQDISEEDAIKEGIINRTPMGYTATGLDQSETAKEAFNYLWESINGAGAWEANPWVWVVSFERIDKPE